MPSYIFMESSPFLLIWLGYCLALIEGELRCYCNESGCVSTGYMCKSFAGQCFTAVEIRDDTTHQTHGCLDNLPKDRRSSCKTAMDLVSTTKSDLLSGHIPLLLCCADHMCNYREDIDISIILTPKYNGTFHRGSAPTGDEYAIYSRNQHGGRDDDRDLWFKAAVIAVPIAGGFILVLLVLLAVRMLRTDSRHHRRLIHIRRESSLTRAHVYISDHFTNKNRKQQFSLFNEKNSNSSAHFYTVANNNSINSKGSNGFCHSSCMHDSSNNFCNHSLHNDKFRSDTNGLIISPKHHNCQTNLPCGSSCSNTTHTTCSKPSDINCSVNSKTAKPRSFYKDTSSLTPCSTKDVSSRTDKSAHTFPHKCRQDSHRTHSVTDHLRHSSVATWSSDSCMKGPAAIV